MSACTVSSPCQFLFITWSHLESYHQYFFVSRDRGALSFWFSGHNSPSLTDEPVCNENKWRSKATSPLCSKRLRWLVLTMIASEMSPLKQQAWQDCRAFSLRGVHQCLAVHYASLIANHPTDTRHVHYGTDGFQARVGLSEPGLIWYRLDCFF